jgi:hypothetical protein
VRVTGARDHASVTSADRFEHVRQAVLADPELQTELQAIEDWAGFLSATLAAAAERGLPLTADDVENARVAARQAWHEHWV